MKDKNILLANFLGLELQDDGTYFDYESNEYINPEDLNYNESWDMLMNVVDKIEKVHNRTVQIERGVCYVHNGGIHHGRSTQIQTKIEAVYNACVEFIEWWNKG